MSISAITFLLACIGGFLLGVRKNPFYALLVYIFIYFNIPDPKFHWWAHEIPQIRWSLVSAILLILCCIFQSHKLSSLSIMGVKNAKWLFYLLFLMFIVTLFSVNFNRSFDRLYDFFRYVVAFVLIIKCVSTLKQYEFLIGLYIISCFHMSWIAWRFGSRQSGRLVGIGTPDSLDTNLIALLFVTSVPFVLSFVLHGKRYQKIAAILMAPFILNGIVLCSSRGAFIACTGSIGVYFVLNNFPNVKWKVGLGCCAAAILFYYLMDPVYIERLSTMFAVGDSDITATEGGTRVKYWLAGFEMVKDHPFGAGGGCFQQLSSRYLPAELLADTGGGELVRSSHNTFILVLVEQGILGFLFFLLFILSTITVLKQTCKRILNGYLSNEKLRQNHDTELIFGQAVALFSSIAGLMIGSVFVDRLYFEPLYWLCALSPVLKHIFETRLIQGDETNHVRQ